MTLEGRGIIVTGGGRGLGRAIAETLVREGAHVLIAGRHAKNIDAAREALAAVARPGQVVIGARADVRDPRDVDAMVAMARDAFPAITGLVNDAGVQGPIACAEDAPWEAWTDAIATNLLGTAYCCRAVLPILRAAGYGKIVNLSGGGAAAPRERFTAYAASKTGVVRFTETLAEETRDARIDVNAIAPGALNTAMLDEVIAAGPDRAGARAYAQALRQQETGGTPLGRGAALTAYLLSAASDGISGRLLAAVWDPWENLAAHRDELNGSDIYTLRRILPADRGRAW